MSTIYSSLPTGAGNDDARTLHSLELPTPDQCRALHPLSMSDMSRVQSDREVIASILRRRDPRLLTIVGPCSVHNVEQVLEYAAKLARARSRFEDALFIAMRVYIEKPRTTVGWRGLALDPRLDASQGPERGLYESRRVMKGVIEHGLPVATESLDPFIVAYVEDLLAFSSLGARTSESQSHRQMAAAMSCSIGIKNATSGDLAVAADAARAIGTGQLVFKVLRDGRVGCQQVSGNQSCALVLRGGAAGPNFGLDDQQQARQMLEQRGVNDAVIVDCSHGNSGKIAERQKVVVDSISRQFRNNEPTPCGVMIESHLRSGNQSAGPLSSLRYGVSVTDDCLGFEDTLLCLETLADAVRVGKQSQPEALATA